jgi:hypothetical protein
MPRQRTTARTRRLVACAVALAVAVVLGGLGGVLLGIFAVMLALDALLPVPRDPTGAAEEHFARAVAERRRAARARRLRGLPQDRLDVLDDATGWAACAERRARGVQAIPVASITGTVEPHKADVFDRRFRPDAGARHPWTRVWRAQVRGDALPPIAVYRIGDRHVVIDGHHRVSVAHDLGLELIDADVLELVDRRPAPRAAPAASGAPARR